MTHDDLLTDIDFVPAKEPAKRWRNWWRARVDGVSSCTACGAQIAVLRGDNFTADYCDHQPIYDSKADAERAALACDCPDWLEYLGAYPEGEHP